MTREYSSQGQVDTTNREAGAAGADEENPDQDAEEKAEQDAREAEDARDVEAEQEKEDLAEEVYIHDPSRDEDDER